MKDTSLMISDTNNTNMVVVNCNAFAPVAHLIDQLLASLQNFMVPTKANNAKKKKKKEKEKEKKEMTHSPSQSLYCFSLEFPSVILRYNIHTVNFYMYLNNVIASLARSLEQVAQKTKLNNRKR